MRVGRTAEARLLLTVVLLAGCGPAAGDLSRKTEPPPQASVAMATPSASPSPSLSPLEEWIFEGRFRFALKPTGEFEFPINTPRIPSTTIYQVLSTELPLVYDTTVKDVRQRDPQAKLAGIEVETWKANDDITDITSLSVFFYSPLDDVLVQYDSRFHPSFDRRSLVIDKPELEPNPWFVDLGSSSGTDFRTAPALRLPATTTWQPALEKTWELAGKPDAYSARLIFSSRAPYDVKVSFGKYDEPLVELGVLVSRFDSYYFAPTIWCYVEGRIPDRTAKCRQK
jgi:hypothetical protein